MRVCTAYKPGVIKTKTGELFGVYLGYDIASEQECGIGPLLRVFGANTKPHHQRYRTDYEIWATRDAKRSWVSKLVLGKTPYPAMGIDKLQPTRTPPQLQWYESEGTGFSGIYCPYNDFTEPSRDLEWRLDQAGEDQMFGAWSDQDFCVMARDPETKELLRRLFNALLKHEALLMTRRFDWYDRDVHGLCLVFRDLIPQEDQDNMREADLARFEGDKKFAESGIVPYLKSKGKKWTSLGRYQQLDCGTWCAWLNTSNDSDGKHGWWTLEDLRLWGEGKGPIMRHQKDTADNPNKARKTKRKKSKKFHNRSRVKGA